MEFARDAELEALIGRVCLVFARVEQAAGHVVASADGEWDAAMNDHYLALSSDSGLLLDWLKAVGNAYPEVKEDLSGLRSDLRALKARRDEWAHSADVVDLYLLMKEQGLTTMSARELRPGQLLNGKARGHIDAPTEADLGEFISRASDVGDAASSLALELAKIADHGVRPVKAPRRASPRPRR